MQGKDQRAVKTYQYDIDNSVLEDGYYAKDKVELGLNITISNINSDNNGIYYLLPESITEFIYKKYSAFFLSNNLLYKYIKVYKVKRPRIAIATATAVPILGGIINFIK